MINHIKKYIITSTIVFGALFLGSFWIRKTFDLEFAYSVYRIYFVSVMPYSILFLIIYFLKSKIKEQSTMILFSKGIFKLIITTLIIIAIKSQSTYYKASAIELLVIYMFSNAIDIFVLYDSKTQGIK